MSENNPLRGPWVETYTGVRFYPFTPRPDEIRIEDIAHSLANQCRFNGHCPKFYSVAEHSILVSRLVPEEVALWGLLHDAGEAYISDIIRPIKAFLHVKWPVEFRSIFDVEDVILFTVAARFGLDSRPPASVFDADQVALVSEYRCFFPSNELPGLGWVTPTRRPIGCQPPEVAERLFLERFNELSGD
jgi:uncharacterized protein